MSTLADTEQALITTVQTVAGYGAATTSRGDFRVADAPGATYSAVITMREPSTLSDRGPDGRGAHGRRVHVHRLRIHHLAKRGSGPDGPAYAGLIAATDALIAALEQYPRLGGGVTSLRRAEVVRISPVLLAGGERGTHLSQQIDVDVVLDVAWSPVEVAR